MGRATGIDLPNSPFDIAFPGTYRIAVCAHSLLRMRAAFALLREIEN